MQIMNLPDFSSYGYQVSKELGHNYTGGRITYLATNSDTQQVVIKQFQFAKSSSNWSGFNAHQREIQLLRHLNHSGIPSYLDSFETPDGFCLVQEYKQAPTLAENRSFDLKQIKQVAVSVLEILVYLQECLPIVIHRDIKPENILMDNQQNVYLIDFGLAHIGGEVSISSLALGTIGFMPPEQLYSRQLTTATDLYSLGVTLVCLLTGTPSTCIDSLIDEDGYIVFQHLVPQASLSFISWLKQMVSPKLKIRYPDAATALLALKSLEIVRLPVALSHTDIEFRANFPGQKLTQSLRVTNSVPETSLVGRWEVALHPSDPPHTPDNHAWIQVTPTRFIGNGNAIECQITINTNKLRLSESYERQVILHTNISPKPYLLTVKVQTASLPLPISIAKIPAVPLPFLIYFFLILFILNSQLQYINDYYFGLSIATDLTSSFAIIVGFAFNFILVEAALGRRNKIFATLLAVALSISMSYVVGEAMNELGMMRLRFHIPIIDKTDVFSTAISGVMLGVGFNCGAVAWKKSLVKAGINTNLALILVLSVSGGSIGSGICLLLKAGQLSCILGSLVIAVPLAVGILHPLNSLLKRKRLIAKYHQSEQHLIEP